MLSMNLYINMHIHIHIVNQYKAYTTIHVHMFGYFFQGAYAGFFSGLIVTMWIGIGAQIYKPSVYKPPVSTSACVINSTIDNMTAVMTTEIPNDQR